MSDGRVKCRSIEEMILRYEWNNEKKIYLTIIYDPNAPLECHRIWYEMSYIGYLKKYYEKFYGIKIIKINRIYYYPLCMIPYFFHDCITEEGKLIITNFI